MKQIQTLSFCDNHEGEPTAPPATHEDLVVKVDMGPAKRLDLCETCFNTIVAPFFVLLVKGETMADGERKRTVADQDRVKCPMPDCHVKPLKSRQTLSAHLRQQHGTTIKELQASGVTV